MSEEKEYKRDKRSPVPKNATASKVMSRIGAKNTKPELHLRKALWEAGMKGYRLHYKKVPGRPDIVFPSQKLAIFVHGCYWHKCPHCNLPSPKHNTAFWNDKFEKNVARDQRKVNELQALGWRTSVVWECEIKKDIAGVIGSISSLWKK